jgi:LCP family protein required for cell wall assembly
MTDLTSNAEAAITTKTRLAFQWWWLIWVAAAISVFLCGAVLGLVSGGGPPGQAHWFSEILAPSFGGRERVTLLALGVDDSEGRGLADTVIAVVVWPRSGDIAALSIPRDSRVYIPGLGNRRVNEAHSFGGLPLMIETVELLLGFPFDYYVEVNVPGLVELVDAMGGIDIEVEKRMYYRDRAQNLVIDLQPGRQHLNGRQAVGYIRFRHDAQGDLGRIERQHKFLSVAADHLLSSDRLAGIPRLADTFVEIVTTNLSVRDMLSLKKVLQAAGRDGIRMATLPGRPRLVNDQSILELDAREVQQAVDRVLWGEGATVAVLNATHLSGFAARTAARLERTAYEVVAVGNAEQISDTTVILNHRGHGRAAQQLAAALGAGVVSSAPDPDSQADLTVILGRDLAGSTR